MAMLKAGGVRSVYAILSAAIMHAFGVQRGADDDDDDDGNDIAAAAR